MTKVMVVAVLGLRRLMRDRTGLFFVLLFPVIITLLIGLSIFKNVGSSFVVGVVDRSQSDLSARFVAALDNSRALETKPFQDRASLETAVRRDLVQGGLIIPSNLEGELKNGRSVNFLFVPGPRSTNAQTIQATVRSIIASDASAIRAAEFATANFGGDFDTNLALATHLQKRDASKLQVESITVGKEGNKAYSGFTYPSASNLILFMFITSMTAASQLVESRKLGINLRMLATPTRPGHILVGLGLSRFLIALFQGFFIFGVSTLMFAVKWGNTVGTLLIIATFALVATAIAMFFGSVLKSPEQANIGVPIGIALGMLGGCMWPLEIVGNTMRTVGHLTPHAWAMDAFIALIGKDAGLKGILPNLSVLVGFAVVILGISIGRFRREMTR